MPMSGTAAVLDFAITPFGAWNTQSLPVVMNDRIDLMSLKPGMSGELWQEPQGEIAVLIPETPLPDLHRLGLALVNDLATEGFFQELQHQNVVDVRHSTDVNRPLG